jgi:sugar lactone lactonase YvrE
LRGATEGSILAGGNGKGKQMNQLHYPNGLSFDRHGNLYVADCFNHRVQKFELLSP